MSTHDVPIALQDRLIDLNDTQISVIRWLRLHPLAHPEEAAAKWELYDALEAEYARLSALRWRYILGTETTWDERKKTGS